MNFNEIENVNVESIEPVFPPYYFKMQKCKRDNQTLKEIYQFVKESRETINKIISREDKRLLIILGPCSIHDPKSALEFAKKLKVYQEKNQEKYFMVMRVYFEKPRTTVGWKGLVYDPELNDSGNINLGLEVCRNLLLDINELKIPCASEFLDVFTPEYFADLISWGAIGARTTESQLHRQLASGLSCPIGFKNGSDGNIQIAIDAIKSASNKHIFFGINDDGNIIKVSTKGNQNLHLILRGGIEPNYYSEKIKKYNKILKENDLNPYVLVDCSHGNSFKQASNQIMVFKDILFQLETTKNKIFGLMLEVNLKFGKQTLKNPKDLEYGKSITDECISIDDLRIIFNF